MGLLLIPDSRFREQTAETVRGAAVDGFIVYSAASNDPRVEAALARGLPVVTVDQPRDAPTAFIGIDDRAAARQAAEHVRDLGHRRVGVLAFVTSIDREGELVLEMSVERRAGYEEGSAPHGTKPQSARAVRTRPSRRGGRPRPTRRRCSADRDPGDERRPRDRRASGRGGARDPRARRHLCRRLRRRPCGGAHQPTARRSPSRTRRRDGWPQSGCSRRSSARNRESPDE